MNVIVRAPKDSLPEVIFERVKKKAPWIVKQIYFFEDFYPKITHKKYTTGETFLYLWRQYILKVEITDSLEYVKIKGKFITIYVKNRERVEEILNQWYFEHARKKFHEYVEPIKERFEKFKVEPWKISIRKMKLRWWSCSRKWNITLNYELIKAPRGCIEYVINHEFCHLLEYGHTKRFYDIQTSQMPDWEKWKSKLERLLS